MTIDIAFFGLGNMGLPMAKNLLRAGFKVAGFDIREEPQHMLASAGGSTGYTAHAAVNEASVVVTMLPAAAHVADLLCGETGLFSIAQAGTLFIDSSTIGPDRARNLHTEAAAKGVRFLDAPVSGGVGGAEAGTLTFMVGGESAAFDASVAPLRAMGRNIYHAGMGGSGQTVKICNNMLLGIQMIGTAETLRLGVSNGIDPLTLSEILIQSSGNNWVLNTCNPCPGVMQNAPASNGYAGGFGVDLMLKDLRIAVENATLNGSAIPLGSLACNLFDLLSKSGLGKLDYGCVFEMLGQKASKPASSDQQTSLVS